VANKYFVNESPSDVGIYVSFFLQKKRSTASCFVRQTANLDYTEPEFEISIRAEDDRSLVRLLLNIGVLYNQD
jgi:hypothetical protein